MILLRRLSAAVRLALVPLVTLTAGLAAQASNTANAQQPPTTREEIESRAQQVEQQAASAADTRLRAQKQAEAAALRTRLREGDFKVGDRFLLTVESPGLATMTDTATVRAGRVLVLDTLTGGSPIQLQGVLRTELQEYLTTQIGRYVKNPVVRAVPLLRLGILGPVQKPGYYWVNSDIPISDLVVVGGGIGGTASLDRTVVKRNSKVVLDRKAVHQAMTAGLTIDQLQLHAGDEVVVGDTANKADWQTAAKVVTGLLSVVFTIRYLVRKR